MIRAWYTCCTTVVRTCCIVFLSRWHNIYTKTNYSTSRSIIYKYYSCILPCTWRHIGPTPNHEHSNKYNRRDCHASQSRRDFKKLPYFPVALHNAARAAAFKFHMVAPTPPSPMMETQGSDRLTLQRHQWTRMHTAQAGLASLPTRCPGTLILKFLEVGSPAVNLTADPLHIGHTYIHTWWGAFNSWASSGDAREGTV